MPSLASSWRDSRRIIRLPRGHTVYDSQLNVLIIAADITAPEFRRSAFESMQDFWHGSAVQLLARRGHASRKRPVLQGRVRKGIPRVMSDENLTLLSLLIAVAALCVTCFAVGLAIGVLL